MRGRVIACATGTALVGLVAVTPYASAATERNQIATYNYSVIYLGPGGLSEYSGSLSMTVACGNIIAGSGTISGIPVTLSNISAQPNASAPSPATFTSTESVDGNPGSSWTFNGTLNAAGLNGEMTGPDFPAGDVNKWEELGASTGVTVSHYTNHGDYVSSAPASMRNAAATSCVGMPTQAGS